MGSGESLVRQFLLGQNFFKKEFGHYCEVVSFIVLIVLTGHQNVTPNHNLRNTTGLASRLLWIFGQFAPNYDPIRNQTFCHTETELESI